MTSHDADRSATVGGSEPPRLPGAGRQPPRSASPRWRAGWLLGLAARRRREKEVLPKHVTPETIRAVIKGLDYLAAQQAEDGSWITGGGQAYPVAMTGLAGTACWPTATRRRAASTAKNVQGAVEFLVRCATPTGLITGPIAGQRHARCTGTASR